MPGARSLRLRLLLISAASVGVSLALACAFLALVFEHHMERRVGQELETRMQEIAAALGAGAAGEPLLTRPLADPRYRTPYSGLYWSIAGGPGEPLRSRSLWDETLPGDPGPAGTAREATEKPGPNGSILYVLERDLSPAPGHSFRVAVAIDHAEIQALQSEFMTEIGGGVLVMGVFLTLGAWLQTGVGLSPLRKLQEQLARIHEGRGSRLGGDFPSEVQPLASTLNALLERQHHLVARARGRAGDLAHGLKTPLTILGAEAQRLDEAGQPESATILREQITLMRSHIERELARARMHGQSAAGGLATDAGRSVARLVDLMRRMPRGEQIDWTVSVDPALRVDMDPDDFGEVMGNLLDNARKAASGRVRVSVEATANEPSAARVVIADDGPGVVAGEEAALVERGRRGTEDGDGSGLGLAIVRDLLAEYHAELALGRSALGGCEAAFVMPCHRVASEDRTHSARPATGLPATRRAPAKAPGA